MVVEASKADFCLGWTPNGCPAWVRLGCSGGQKIQKKIFIPNHPKMVPNGWKRLTNNIFPPLFLLFAYFDPDWAGQPFI